MIRRQKSTWPDVISWIHFSGGALVVMLSRLTSPPPLKPQSGAEGIVTCCLSSSSSQAPVRGRRAGNLLSLSRLSLSLALSLSLSLSLARSLSRALSLFLSIPLALSLGPPAFICISSSLLGLKERRERDNRSRALWGGQRRAQTHMHFFISPSHVVHPRAPVECLHQPRDIARLLCWTHFRGCWTHF